MKRWRGWGERLISVLSPEFQGHGERQALRGGGRRLSSRRRGTHDSGTAAAAGGEVGARARIGLTELCSWARAAN